VKPRSLSFILVLAGVAGCASMPPHPQAKPGAATSTVAAPTPPAPTALAPAPLPDGPPVERIAVPADGPSRGAATAKVTIVEFSDFQCPFCSRVQPTLQQVLTTYPDDVRIVFRHNPLPFHMNAPLAAEAAVVAEWKGKFWEMHDNLFAHQSDLDRAGLEFRAVELGLDLVAFRAALDSHTAKARVDADIALASRLGARGTPTFFIDGRPLVGAQPFDAFKQIIDDEIGRADSLLRRGLPRDRLYATLLTGAKPSVSRVPGSAGGAGAEVYRVPTLDAPVRGGAQPKVTIIEFGDFQCPFTARVKPTLDTLLKSYGPDLALVFRHNPLPFHPNALPAALAAEAARQQGKFWEMHDKLFANREALDRPSLDKYAAELGLDAARFAASVDGEVGKDRIARDEDDARRFSSGGTPVFFINGRPLNGAQPIEVFRQAIDEEIRKVDVSLAAGVPRADLYATITKYGLDKRLEPPAPPAKPDPDADLRIRVDVAGAPARGPADAPITIVEFADFQCPFCARAEETVERLRHDYPNDLRIVWRDMPLPFHQQAMPAAIAARAARAQGKFWAMHDRFYADHLTSLGRERFEKEAAELGIEMKRFRAALDADAGKAGVDADALAGAKAGASGTPTFFVNGKAIHGAQSYETFKARIDAELKLTEAMIAKGTPRARIYAALMKDALPVHPPAKPKDDADDNDRGPEADITVYPVKPGDAPAKGPANAPLVVVVFSDFQCPFCKRVEPTLAEMEKHYAGKVRVVWKNYPLPFHNNAKPAAEAAMAAQAQGKFWEMHDKLFENNSALDRASLEKYAAELGLDLPRFKADLDAERYKDRIEGDMAEGSAVTVVGTPAVFINGRKIAGAYPFETFQLIADAELAKAEAKTEAKTEAKADRKAGDKTDGKSKKPLAKKSTARKAR
jgi:protein-disulfide isomerase